MKKKILSIFIVLAMFICTFSGISFAENTEKTTQTNESHITDTTNDSNDENNVSVLPEYDGDWTTFRGNLENMGITHAKTPVIASLTGLKWSAPVAELYNPNTQPLIVNDNIYIVGGNRLLSINKENGEIFNETELASSISYSTPAISYGGGMIFVPLSGGKIQALRADNLESIWISEALGGNLYSPITYNNGKIYTGTQDSDTTDGKYVCIDIADTDPLKTDEEKEIEWEVIHKGGFFWAGAYLTDEIIVFGGDDGDTSSDSETAILYSISPVDGTVNDTIDNIKGDIRSSISYDNNSGSIFFTTKCGMFYMVNINADGTFGEASSIDLGGQSTVTPIISDGLAYVGISGENAFSSPGAYKVIDISSDLEIVSSVEIPGYPQGSGLISDAYTEESGKTYLYTTYNKNPGGIYLIEVSKNDDGTVSVEGSDLYIPEEENQNYCLSTVICDSDGTLYYTNDTGNLFAIEKLKSDENKITSFKIGSYTGEINNAYKTITVNIGRNDDLTVLSPEISISPNATVSPESGSQVDFTNPVKYIVTAENGTTTEYTVTVFKASDNSNNLGSNLGSGKITVYFTMEKSTLGQGFVIEPVKVSVKSGTTVSQVLADLLNEKISADVPYKYKGTIENFYLSHVYDTDSDAFIPDFITDALYGNIGAKNDADYLGEFDYSNQSGWLYLVNNESPSVGASDYELKDGDVVRWQFSIYGYGADLGLENEFMEIKPLVSATDKDSLIKAIAKLNANENKNTLLKNSANKQKYDNAMKVLSSLDSTQEEIKTMILALGSISNSGGSGNSGSSGGSGGSVSGSISSAVTNNPTENSVVNATEEITEISASNKNSFKDTENHWAKDYIDKLADANIINGKTENSFLPDDTVTRAEFLTMLFRISKDKSGNKKQSFNDVNENDWYTEAVYWGINSGITAGTGNSLFSPYAKISRQDMAVMLYRYIIYKEYKISYTENLELFRDNEEIAAYATDAIYQIRKLGIINGRENNLFAPSDSATRAEAAKIMCQLIDNFIEK